MLRTLIVEDDALKRQRISEVLITVPGFDPGWLSQEADGVSARRALQTTTFDLLILDIAIPDRIDKAPSDDGGIRLLDEIQSRADFRVPRYIIGVTAHDRLLSETKSRFDQQFLSVLHYDPTSDAWAEQLRSGVTHLVGVMDQTSGRTDDYRSHLVVVCALESPELDSILELPWSWEDRYVRGDDTKYHRGRLQRDGEERVIWAAYAARKGMPAAGVLATKMIYSFSPEYVVMPGVTASIAERASFGDVIVAEMCWDWGSGKWVTEDGDAKLLLAPHQAAPASNLLAKLRLLPKEVGVLAEVKQRWLGVKPKEELAVRVGPIASGSAVIGDRSFRARIVEQHRELLGIEMEAYAVFVAAQEAAEPRPKVFAMKSVMDFADSVKDDRYKGYAAYTSARVLQHFVEKHL